MIWTIALIAAFVCVLVFAYLYHQAVTKALSQKDGEIDRLRRALSCHAAEVAAYRTVLASNAGGVGKRISECREIAEAIQRHSPDLYEREHGMVFWLSAMDEFLVALHSAYDPGGEGDLGQARLATSRDADIYRLVQSEAQSKRVSAVGMESL